MVNFIFTSRGNRKLLLSASLLSILLFFVFKLFYPYPNMVMDSYVYIRPLVEGKNVNSFPMGYTWFLGIFSWLSRSTTLLVWVQYLFFVAAGLLFFFTLIKFFQPARLVTILLFVFLFANPLFLYSSNFIMSDMLFTTLSILWLTQLIWIIGQPRNYLIFSLAALLLLVFSVRYNALYYPVVASVMLVLVGMRLWVKIVGIALQFALIGAFILFTTHQMKVSTGLGQFSPFGGWRMANNALYMYGHVCLEKNELIPTPEQFGQLDTMVHSYFSRAGKVDDLTDNRSGGAFYGADPNAPLVQYMYRQYGPDTTFLDLTRFSRVAPLYSAYGTYLVRKYPLDYCRWFLWPSTIRYMFSPPEIFSTLSPYYLRNDKIGRQARQWFRLKTLMVSPGLINFRNSLLAPYTLLLTLIHFAFILGMTGFLLFRGWKRAAHSNGLIMMTVIFFWIFDFFFKITAGAIVLRHQLFLMVVEFAFALLFMDLISRGNPTIADAACYSSASKKHSLCV